MFISCYLYALFSSDYFYSTSQCVKTRTYHDRNKCNIPCIYVCNPISLHANLILIPSTFLLFAELQSYSSC